jgi:hypothetical protein
MNVQAPCFHLQKNSKMSLVASKLKLKCSVSVLRWLLLHSALIRTTVVLRIVAVAAVVRSHVGHGRWLRRYGPGRCQDSPPGEAAGSRAQAHSGSQEVRGRPGRPSPVRLWHLRGRAPAYFPTFSLLSLSSSVARVWRVCGGYWKSR